MFEVRVEADFAAAHFLTNYHGKCEHLHGHNYRVLAYAKNNELDSGGMLLDFGVLKKALRQICSQLDHTNLNDMECFEQNPSAERIAKWIFDSLKNRLSSEEETKDCAKYLYKVDVYETSTSRASYYE